MREMKELNKWRDSTLMTESKEELSLLVRVKEESEKAFLKLNRKKVRTLPSGTINFMANQKGKSGAEFCQQQT